MRLIGDVPIYVGRGGGATVETRPELFLDGAVAGVPPDAFSDDGQLWGNPLYDWPAHRARPATAGGSSASRRTFELVDAVPHRPLPRLRRVLGGAGGRADARAGRWRRGPGRALFDAVLAELGALPLVAEDLGVITPPVERLRDELGLPGMAVLQFGFDGGAANPHRPENVEEDGVVYTATHDTDTALDWCEALPERARRRTGLDPADPAWSLIRTAWRTRARVALIAGPGRPRPRQEARMNRPGTSEGNWAWRLREGQLTNDLADRLREETEAAGRL